MYSRNRVLPNRRHSFLWTHGIYGTYSKIRNNIESKVTKLISLNTEYNDLVSIILFSENDIKIHKRSWKAISWWLRRKSYHPKWYWVDHPNEEERDRWVWINTFSCFSYSTFDICRIATNQNFQKQIRINVRYWCLIPCLKRSSNYVALM